MLSVLNIDKWTSDRVVSWLAGRCNFVCYVAEYEQRLLLVSLRVTQNIVSIYS